MAQNTLIIVTGSNAVFNFKKAYFNISQEEAIERYSKQHIIASYPDVQVIEFDDVLTLSTSPDGTITIDISEDTDTDSPLE